MVLSDVIEPIVKMVSENPAKASLLAMGLVVGYYLMHISKLANYIRVIGLILIVITVLGILGFVDVSEITRLVKESGIV